MLIPYVNAFTVPSQAPRRLSAIVFGGPALMIFYLEGLELPMEGDREKQVW